MEVVIQYWKQGGGDLLISVSRNRKALHQVHNLVHTAENRTVEVGDSQLCEISDACSLALGVTQKGTIFISHEEYLQFVRPLNPPTKGV